MAKEISNPEDMSIKDSQPYTHTGKAMKKMEENIQELQGIFKRFNILLTRIPEEKRGA